MTTDSAVVSRMPRPAPGMCRGAAVDYPALCLHEVIQAQADRTPLNIAVRGNGESLTYAELAARSNQLAAYLRSRGFHAGGVVGICVERSPHMLTGLLGIMKAGCAYIPVDPSYPADRRRAILRDGQVRLLISQQSLATEAASFDGDIFYLDSDWRLAAAMTTATFSSGATIDDRAYIIYTSGSTGRPKGVQIPHKAVVNLLHCMERELSVRETDVLAALASFAFDMCVPELYLPLISGATVLMAPPGIASDGEQLLSLIEAHGATIMQATPTAWALLHSAGFRNRGMRVISGAEPLPPDICSRLLECTERFHNFYGPTETTVWSTFADIGANDDRVSIGRPLDNTQVYILDEKLDHRELGESGEIFIGGDGVALGYLGEPRLTAESFIPNPFSAAPGARMYRTRDLGRFLADGRIDFGGRTDHQVKIRGFRVELGEVEAALRACAEVRDAVVAVRGDGTARRLIAYVASDSASPQTLRSAIAAKLPDYMIPAGFVVVPELPRLANGKIDRNPPLPESPAAGEAEINAGSGTEQFLISVWQEVLKVGSILPSDDLFRLGADSLASTQVATRIRNHFRIHIPLRMVFGSHSVSELAAAIDNLVEGSAADLLGRASETSLLTPVEQMSEDQLNTFLGGISFVEAADE